MTETLIFHLNSISISLLGGGGTRHYNSLHCPVYNVLQNLVSNTSPCSIAIWLGLQLWMLRRHLNQSPWKSDGTGTNIFCIWNTSNYSNAWWENMRWQVTHSQWKLYLPEIISWIDKENRCLYATCKFLRKETLILQFIIQNSQPMLYRQSW